VAGFGARDQLGQGGKDVVAPNLATCQGTMEVTDPNCPLRPNLPAGGLKPGRDLALAVIVGVTSPFSAAAHEDAGHLLSRLSAGADNVPQAVG